MHAAIVSSHESGTFMSENLRFGVQRSLTLDTSSSSSSSSSSFLPPSSQHPIQVSHGCLLITVFFAAWIYYTKRCIRKIAGLIRNVEEPDLSEDNIFRGKSMDAAQDAYMNWDSEQTGLPSTTASFVKWINRRNVRRRQVQHDLEVTTRRVLSSASSAESILFGPPSSSEPLRGQEQEEEQEQVVDEELPPSDSNTSYPKWEFLSHFGSMELESSMMSYKHRAQG